MPILKKRKGSIITEWLMIVVVMSMIASILAAIMQDATTAADNLIAKHKQLRIQQAELLRDTLDYLDMEAIDGPQN